MLTEYRANLPTDLEPLARTRGRFELPEAWKLHTFRDKGFLYLWNTNQSAVIESWLSDKPDRVRVPYNIGDKRVRDEFETKYAGQENRPIFSDPRIVPAFYGVGPAIFATDAQGELGAAGKQFIKWLDEHPDRPFAMLMNYAGPAKIGDKGISVTKYRDRYVGSVAGESLGYFDVDPKAMAEAAGKAQTRRQLVEAFTPLSLTANAAKYRAVFDQDLDANAYVDVIPCPSVGNIAFPPIEADWAARTIGYESSAMTSSLLPMRWAFMRGAARTRRADVYVSFVQFRRCIDHFFRRLVVHQPQEHPGQLLQRVFRAGMTWYKFDIWYQYMAGSAMFYHEQGFDEYWKPGGTTVAGEK